MKKKKLNLKKIIIFILIVLLFIYLYTNYTYTIFNNNQTSGVIIDSNHYKVIKQDINDNYSGIGQKNIKNKDGYFTTFTTENKNKKTYIEYKQNGNSSWSEAKYWGGSMNKNGCGITVMSIILSGYGKNHTPNDLRKKYYPVLNYNNLSHELYSTFGIKNSDFYYDSKHLSNNYILKHLNSNRPVIICVWNKPHNNRWTTTSHYMALLAATDDNLVYISNPNGLENDSKSSGWYDINDVSPYIAKAIYIQDYT